MINIFIRLATTFRNVVKCANPPIQPIAVGGDVKAMIVGKRHYPVSSVSASEYLQKLRGATIQDARLVNDDADPEAGEIDEYIEIVTSAGTVAIGAPDLGFCFTEKDPEGS
jgi:hypothetical protein